MGKYYPLYEYLKRHSNDIIVLNYEEIEQIISAKLPASAYKYKEWWDNNSHIQSVSWIEAGYKVDDVALGEKATFVKL